MSVSDGTKASSIKVKTKDESKVTSFNVKALNSWPMCCGLYFSMSIVGLKNFALVIKFKTGNHVIILRN